jgi:hypothetical protein
MPSPPAHSGRSRDGAVTIYVTTMRSDYRLAKALIASIEAFSSCRDIVVLPDDDYREPTMFGYPVWRPTDPRVLALDGYYKKLRIFWGPAERFMLVDADQLVLKNLDPFLARLADLEPPFFVVNRSTRVLAEWQQPGNRSRICRDQVGDGRFLRPFDDAYDLETQQPFCSGEFAASRDVVRHDHLLDVFEQARAMHREQIPGTELVRSRAGMFMADQGFLNYYVRRWCPAEHFAWIDDLYWWGGNSESLDRDDAADGPLKGVLMHWAGCPRPGPIPLWFSPPKAREWRGHYRTYCRSRRDWGGFLADTRDYVVHSSREGASRAKRRLYGLFASHSKGRSRGPDGGAG